MTKIFEIKYSVYQVSKTRWSWEVWSAADLIKRCPGYYNSEDVARAEVKEWLKLKYPLGTFEEDDAE